MSQTTGGRYAANRQDSLPSVTADIHRRVKRIESGAGGGSVGDESDPTEGFGNITDLTLSTYTVRDNVKGTDRANIDVNWTPIATTTAEAGDPSKAKVRDYLVSHTLDGGRYTAEKTVVTPPTTITGLPLQQTVTVRVRARSTTGILGPFVLATITTTKDVTPPNKPSTPTIAPAIRSLKISWDGKDSQGADQPSDFQRCDLHLANGNNFTPTPANKIHQFGRGGGTHTYSDPREGSFTSWVKLVAYDFAGNASVPSDEASSATQDAIGVNSLIGGGNLLLNSGFDDMGTRDAQGNINGVTRWTTNAVFNSTLFLSATQPRHGAFTAQFTGTTYLFLYQDVVLPPGQYWMTAYLRSTAGATSSAGAGVAVEQVTNGNLVIKSTTRFTTAQTDYVRSRINFTITANCTLRMLVTNSYGGTATGQWFLDDAQLEEGEIPTAWAPKPNELAFGQVTSFEIADFAIGEADINTGAIVADKIKAGAILADKIAAGEVTTSKLTITNISNLIADPSFELQLLSNGQAGRSWVAQAGWSIEESTGISRTGKRAAVFRGTTAAITNSVRIPVVAGESYAATAWFNSGSTGGGQGVVRINSFDKNGAFLRSLSGNVVPPGQAYSRSICVIGGVGGSTGGIAADTSFIEFDLAVFSNTGTWYADDCQLRRLNEGELIVDGSITATKITANILTADKLTIGSVTADNLCMNPSFEDDGSSVTWADKWYTQQGPMASRTNTNTLSGGWSAYVPSGSWNLSAQIPVVPGEVYYISAQIAQPSGGGGVWFGVGTFTSDTGDMNYNPAGVGGQIWAVQSISPGNPVGGGRYEAQFTCPSNVKFVKMACLDFNSGQHTVFDDVTIRKVSGSTSIKDGAITTNKIFANAVRANHIDVGTIQASHINTAGLRADQITSGVIYALKYSTGSATNEFNEHHIEILDGLDKDAIRWYAPGRVLKADLRGSMGAEAGFRGGLYLNSNEMQIGHTQSILYQVGKRQMRGGDPSIRVRAGQVRAFATGGVGNFDIFFESGMSQPPTVAVVMQQYDVSSGFQPMHILLREVYSTHLHLVCTYAGGHPATGQPPGNGYAMTFNYYVEVGI